MAVGVDISGFNLERGGIDRTVCPWYVCTMAEDKGVINLRAVPVPLIRRAKAAAALQGKTLRIFVIEAIQEKIRKKQ